MWARLEILSGMIFLRWMLVILYALVVGICDVNLNVWNFLTLTDSICILYKCFLVLSLLGI